MSIDSNQTAKATLFIAERRQFIRSSPDGEMIFAPEKDVTDFRARSRKKLTRPLIGQKILRQSLRVLSLKAQLAARSQFHAKEQDIQEGAKRKAFRRNAFHITIHICDIEAEIGRLIGVTNA